MVTTGLRVGEVQTAEVKDIETTTGIALLYIKGKGRDTKDSFVVLEPSVLDAIDSYLKARGNYEGSLFKGLSNRSNGKMAKDSISRIIKTRFKAIGLDNPRYTAHSLRHTAGTLSILSGAKLEETQQLLKHSNINTTMIYNHSLDAMQNIAGKKLVARLNEEIRNYTI